MEINSLVIVGILLILISVFLTVYLRKGAVREWIKHQLEDKDYAEEKKKELEEVDKKTKEELERVQKELADLKSKDQSDKKEVFLIKNNEFTQEQAPKVCKALFNADIATKEQVQNSFNNGANWCNYGWVKEEEQAYYPLQKDQNTSVCKGTKGLNGGILDGDNLKIGISCYGVKPDKNTYYNLEKLYSDQSYAETDMKMLEDYRAKLAKKEINLQPFNADAWSRYEIKKADPEQEGKN